MENRIGITNFRDIGGYKTRDGYTVKKGVLFRSSPILFDSEENKQAFIDLNIQNILDFRSSEEVEMHQDDVVENSQYIRISALKNEQNFDLKTVALRDDVDTVRKMFRIIYENLPFSNKAYQKMFDLLCAHESMVFHCTAGKDRTGVASLLILKTLGVSDEIIMQDYLKSNDNLNEGQLKILPQLNESLQELFYAREKYLNYTMEAIHSKYSSFEEFLNVEYNIDEEKIELIKSYYLEDYNG